MRREQIMCMTENPDGLDGHNARMKITNRIAEDCRNNPKSKRRYGHKKEFRFYEDQSDIYIGLPERDA